MITEDAVEAAAHALFEKELGRPMEVSDEGLYAEDIIACREDARAALEAAAPFMRQAFMLDLNMKAVQDELSRPLFPKAP